MDNTPTNAHEYSVSELALSLKRTVEETYGRVRVRGEFGRVVIAKSGHMYVDIKDDKAVIASIMWKGSVDRLSVRPEEGMEVIVEGKLSTYPGRSQYQLIIDRLEPAGVGALMALLEKRKKQFAAEGLFDESRKRDLPYLPQTIGVVTSPTGAVIRDILHRISDRFPVRVLGWPVLVQGDRAAEQITAAIDGFNALTQHRPDLLIVARGGGSIEDLWCFNEENVVRAAAASQIPLISAVGHETDWTLIDYVADARAPTPTGAAEIAVPVRSELIETVDDYALRLRRGLSRTVEHKALGLSGAKLPRLDSVLSAPRQRFDMAAGRLLPALDINRKAHESRLRELAAKLPRLESILSKPQQRLSLVGARLAPALDIARRGSAGRLREVAGRLRPEGLLQSISRRQDRLASITREANALINRRIERGQDKVLRAGKLLDAYSYEGVLARGYVLVTDEGGGLVRDGAILKAGQAVHLQFADTKRKAVIDGTGGTLKSEPAKKNSVQSEQKQKPAQKQLGLF